MDSCSKAEKRPKYYNYPVNSELFIVTDSLPNCAEYVRKTIVKIRSCNHSHEKPRSACIKLRNCY